MQPGLTESVRHGVTTALIGSCGLSMVGGKPEDMADMFCRVEGVPRDMVLPLGTSFVGMAGDATLRAHVMGLGRSLGTA